MWRTAKFPHNIIRPSNCYTEGQQLYRIIPKAMVTALKHDRLPLHGGGMAVKSYLHADNLSKAILLVAKKAPLGTTYNVGPEQPIAIRGLVRLICKVVGVEWDQLVEEVPDRVGQDARYAINCDAIKEFGWSEEVKLWQGLQSVFSWVSTYPELLTMSTTYEHRA